VNSETSQLRSGNATDDTQLRAMLPLLLLLLADARPVSMATKTLSRPSLFI